MPHLQPMAYISLFRKGNRILANSVYLSVNLHLIDETVSKWQVD